MLVTRFSEDIVTHVYSMWDIREQLLCMLSYIAELFWLSQVYFGTYQELSRSTTPLLVMSPSTSRITLPSSIQPTFAFSIHRLSLKLFHIVSPGAYGWSSSRWVSCIKETTICYFSSQFCATLARIWLFLLFSLDPLLPSWANKSRQIAASLLPLPVVIPETPVSNRNTQHPKVVMPPLHRLPMPSSICCTLRNS